MKHPLNRFGRRNRNIMTGIAIGAASLFLIAYYLDIHNSELVLVLVAILLFIAAIMAAAVLFVFVIKGAVTVVSRDSRDEAEKASDSPFTETESADDHT